MKIILRKNEGTRPVTLALAADDVDSAPCSFRRFGMTDSAVYM